MKNPIRNHKKPNRIFVIRTQKAVLEIGFQDLVSIWNLMELNLRKATDFGKQN